MRWIVVGLVLVAGAAYAQEAKPVAPAVRNAVLAYQQMGAGLETLSAYYEARIEELKRLCGDPCKEK
jgi:hypothetical protein